MIGASARFYSRISIEHSQHVIASTVLIEVFSIQFHQTVTFTYNYISDDIVCISDAKNVFIEKCVILVLRYLKGSLNFDEFSHRMENIRCEGKLRVALCADNDFYSQIDLLKSKGLPLVSESLKTIARFHPCPIDATGKVVVSKTGMGSSAALTTSLVGAFLQYFNAVDLSIESEEDKLIVHNLSQLVHAIGTYTVILYSFMLNLVITAQGKIGSGFDVASAVYGSLIYRRFHAEGLNGLDEKVAPSVIRASVVNTEIWNQSITTFTLPPPLSLMMGDVCGGSSSVSMAKAVLEWRRKPNSMNTWNALAECNSQICTAFQELESWHKRDEKWYHQSIDAMMLVEKDDWVKDPLMKRLLEIKQLFRKARKLLKLIGEEAGVEIEPNSQTVLSNSTDDIPGVLCAGVPGAGGVDAIFCIVHVKARNAVESLWSQWSHTTVCPLLLVADDRGVRLE